MKAVYPLSPSPSPRALLLMPRRNVVIGVPAAAVGLAAALVAILPGRSASPTPAGLPQLFWPFTGEPVSALGPVLAVKIDNLAQARPRTGLTEADIVYIPPVEGELSRQRITSVGQD